MFGLAHQSLTCDDILFGIDGIIKIGLLVAASLHYLTNTSQQVWTFVWIARQGNLKPHILRPFLRSQCGSCRNMTKIKALLA
jgi:hypothetical protein